MAKDNIAFDYFAESQLGGNAGGMNNVNVAFCGDPSKSTYCYYFTSSSVAKPYL